MVFGARHTGLCQELQLYSFPCVPRLVHQPNSSSQCSLRFERVCKAVFVLVRDSPTGCPGNRYQWEDLLYLLKLNYSTYFDVSNLILSSLLLLSQFHSAPLFSCSPPATQTTSSYPAVKCYRERHDKVTPGGWKGVR
jgi:hypothetical protein